MLAIGLMSGTSMDGIDAALLETDGKLHIKEKINSCLHLDYDPRFKILLKAAEYAVCKHTGNLSLAAEHFTQDAKCYFEKLNIHDLTPYQFYLYNKSIDLALSDIIEHSTQLHANAIFALLKQMNLSSKDIDLIGYHGQTLFHHPAAKITVQIGNGKLLSTLTNIPVVYDFRRADVDSGGQGAPFAPIYHHGLCMRDNLSLPIAVVNCGGIANITLIKEADETKLIGFDTGPGNALIDSLLRQFTNGSEVMDHDGKYGMQGKINEAVLTRLLNSSLGNYFTLKPPKSLDYNQITLIPEVIELAENSLVDACRTLEAFTAICIIKALDWIKIKPKTWILAGGGWENPVILEELKLRLKELNPAVTIKKADEINWNNQALEAQLMAYLAVRSTKQLPLSFPGTTAVAKPQTGGVPCNFHLNGVNA